MSGVTPVETLLNSLGRRETALLRELLERGLDPDATDSRSWTPLIAAARAGNLEAVKLLLQAGASPGKTNRNGTTPLMYAKTAAFASGNTSVMARLLEAGADINARDNRGVTLLDYVETNYVRLRDFLEAHGALGGAELDQPTRPRPSSTPAG